MQPLNACHLDTHCHKSTKHKQQWWAGHEVYDAEIQEFLKKGERVDVLPVPWQSLTLTVFICWLIYLIMFCWLANDSSYIDCHRWKSMKYLTKTAFNVWCVKFCWYFVLEKFWLLQAIPLWLYKYLLYSAVNEMLCDRSGPAEVNPFNIMFRVALKFDLIYHTSWKKW